MRIFNFISVTLAIINSTLISCNIWDNFYSNLEYTVESIPDELIIELYTNEQKETKVAEVYISAFHNKIKLLLFESLKLKNLANNNKSNITDTKLSSLTIDLDQGNILLTTDLSCIFKTLSYLKNKVSISFLLSSYDIITYYNNATNYDEYIITEQFGLSKLYEIFGLNELISDDKKDVLSKTLMMFKVNKTNGHLEKIAFKYTGGNYVVFYTSVVESEIIDKEVFRDAYLVSEISPRLCNLIQDEKQFLKIVYEQLIKLFV
jgi:hypothetical protein